MTVDFHFLTLAACVHDGATLWLKTTHLRRADFVTSCLYLSYGKVKVFPTLLNHHAASVLPNQTSPQPLVSIQALEFLKHTFKNAVMI